MTDTNYRGPCWQEIEAMNLDATIEGAGASGPEVLWQLRVTIEVEGNDVPIMGHGMTAEDAACDALRQIRGAQGA